MDARYYDSPKFAVVAVESLRLSCCHRSLTISFPKSEIYCSAIPESPNHFYYYLRIFMSPASSMWSCARVSVYVALV